VTRPGSAANEIRRSLNFILFQAGPVTGHRTAGGDGAGPGTRQVAGARSPVAGADGGATNTCSNDTNRIGRTTQPTTHQSPARPGPARLSASPTTRARRDCPVHRHRKPIDDNPCRLYSNELLYGRYLGAASTKLDRMTVRLYTEVKSTMIRILKSEDLSVEIRLLLYHCTDQ